MADASELTQPLRCPDENALGAFVQGGASDAQRREIEAHLEHCAECSGVVQLLGEAFISRAQRIEAGPASERAVESLEPQPGHYLGRYRVDHGIGAGGMGLVFSAWDPALERSVALKLLRPELAATPEARERLFAEARTVASLKHPNVIPVFDVGEADGRVFIAMELVDGVTLDRWRALTKPSLERLLDVFRQAGAGLAAAHAQGLVHRDFKPQNLLVTTDERVLVTDFGLAFSVGDAAREIAGTPAYMAPEQRAGTASVASDQYSFALCLAESLGATLSPSGAAPELPASIPDWLRAVLQRALAHDPATRYPDLSALVAELEGGSGVNASAHVTANAILLGGWTVLHGFWLIVMIWAGVKLWLDPNLMDPPQSAESVLVRPTETPRATQLAALRIDALPPKGAARDSAREAEKVDPEDDEPLDEDPLADDPADDEWVDEPPLTFTDSAIVTYSLYWGTWMLLGVLWAPLNAIGLWRRKAWARISTILYAGFSAFSILGLPYAGYAIFSLTRPGVVRLFSQVQTTRAPLRADSVVKGQVHLMINTLVQIGLWLLHLGLFWVSFEFLRFGNEDGSLDTPPILIIGLVMHGLGILWTPLNAWGLYRRAPWARWSSLVYASLVSLTGVGLPYTVYAWVSLSFDSVKARFAPS
ncbi:MAG: protein kinase [Polyangiaceae bacterium]|nr:protein kinase [Polyangiaceae bacterium]